MLAVLQFNEKLVCCLAGPHSADAISACVRSSGTIGGTRVYGPKSAVTRVGELSLALEMVDDSHGGLAVYAGT